MVWWCGPRGGVSFALAMHARAVVTDPVAADVIPVAALFVAIVSLFVIPPAIPPLARRLKLVEGAGVGEGEGPGGGGAGSDAGGPPPPPPPSGRYEPVPSASPRPTGRTPQGEEGTGLLTGAAAVVQGGESPDAAGTAGGAPAIEVAAATAAPAGAGVPPAADLQSPTAALMAAAARASAAAGRLTDRALGWLTTPGAPGGGGDDDDDEGSAGH